MKTVTPFAAGALFLAGSIALAAPANAAPSSTAPNQLQCFAGPTDESVYGGKCTLSNKGAKPSAKLSNTDGDPDGSYSGVYIVDSPLTGSLLGDVKQLSFNYTGIPTNGSPRISLPLDTDGDNVTDVYAFISAYWCNNGMGLVDAIRNSTCQIYVGSDSPYPGWDAFVAAYPTATVGSDGTLPFVIADDSGSTASWTVSNVILGEPGKK